MKWVSTLVKIRKDNLDKIERELIKLNYQISKESEKLYKLKEEMKNFSLPFCASGGYLQQYRLQKSYAREVYLNQQNIVDNLYHHQQMLQEKLKEANMEYEQANYINAQYLKEQIKKSKHKEQIFTDELSSQQFYLKNRGKR